MTSTAIESIKNPLDASQDDSTDPQRAAGVLEWRLRHVHVRVCLGGVGIPAGQPGDPMAADLHVTEGVAGQGIAISGSFAVVAMAGSYFTYMVGGR